jgi:glycosyltransferase involved in cell wall biosynthesis
MRRYNAFLVANPGIDIILICFLSKFIPYNKTLNVAFDVLLIRPETIKHKALAYVEQILFFGIDNFFCNHKDTAGYEKYYGINKEKFYYVPFKANNYSILSDFEIRDKGYVLANGASYRDYETFLKAVTKLGYPTKIILPAARVAKYHQTILDEKLCPENVSVIRHDFNMHTWNEYIANASMVVIPIKKGTLQSAGISVYFEAMALGKPIVITEGVSTRGILTKEVAEIVPAGDPGFLASSIEKLWENKEYRDRLAKNGKQFALSLKGAERMVKDILMGIYSFLEQSSA